MIGGELCERIRYADIRDAPFAQRGDVADRIPGFFKLAFQLLNFRFRFFNAGHGLA